MLADQREYIVVDQYGPDPLLDDSYDAIRAVTSSTTYKVTAVDQYNPALIAFNVYRNKKWWRAILVFNAIDDLWDLKEGMTINIPDINEMTTLLQRLKSVNTNQIVTI